MANETRITVEIIPGNNPFLLTITNEEEEELVRAAAKQVRQFFRLYRDAFPENCVSNEDIMAMIAVDITTRHLRLEKENDTERYTSKIQQLDNELREYLRQTS